MAFIINIRSWLPTTSCMSRFSWITFTYSLILPPMKMTMAMMELVTAMDPKNLQTIGRYVSMVSSVAMIDAKVSLDDLIYDSGIKECVFAMIIQCT